MDKTLDSNPRSSLSSRGHKVCREMDQKMEGGKCCKSVLEVRRREMAVAGQGARLGFKHQVTFEERVDLDIRGK